MSPRTQARIVQNQWKKKQERLASARSGYVRGALSAANIGAKMVQEGWVDGKLFERELLRRIKIVRR